MILDARLWARNCWMRSANRGSGYNVTYVNSSGNCNNNNANNALRAAPDRAWIRAKGLREAMVTQDSICTRSLHPRGMAPEQSEGDGPCDLRDVCPITAEDVIGFDALWESMLKSRKGVMWKGSVASFCLNGAESIARLSTELRDGTYRPGRNTCFTVTSPKPRDVVAQTFRDRVYHRSIVDNLVYPLMSTSWIYDNTACQRGKGTDFARDRYRKHLRDQYLHGGTEAYVLSVDVRGYYKNIPHDRAEALFDVRLPEWGRDMVVGALMAHYPGDVGYNPGSDIVQMVGVSYLSDLDHHVKERLHVRGYLRYMDDLRLIHGDERYLERCLRVITDELGRIGLEPHPKKTTIRPVTKADTFLGFDFRMLGSGKVIMTLTGANVKAMRRRVGRLHKLEVDGLRPPGTTDTAYAGWRAHAEKGDSKELLARCDEWYAHLAHGR